MAPRPAYTVEQLREDYAAGLSTAALGLKYGRSQSSVVEFMQTHGIVRRPQCLPPRRYGPEHPGWKGAAVSYGAAHDRVVAYRGRPRKCSRCGTRSSRKTYDWANLTGNYGDVNDYIRVCRSCHRTLDKEKRRVVPN